MNALINRLESKMSFPDLGKLILRISFSLMFLLHGLEKIYGGTAFIQALFINIGLPGFLAYSVYLGEIIAPVLIILGIYTRLSSVFVIGTCLIIIKLLYMDNLFAISQSGAWAVENVGMYLFSSIAILFIGPGKYALQPD